jgi:Ca-activated chloride channel family protein
MVLRSSSLTRQIIKLILLSIGLIFLFLALLHPRWNKREENVAQEGRDLFIALDVSRSMLAQDFKPNRLEFAKNKIKELVRQLSCERVGLILFSGATVMQCPLTSDHAAFALFLDSVDVETISSGTTALDKAIKRAIESFKKMPERKHKILIMFTDGEDFSHNLSGVKRDALQANMSIFTLGVGTTEGEPVPVVDAQGNKKEYLRDEKGSVVISRLNEEVLRKLAEESGGNYMPSTHDKADINALVKLVQQFEKEKIKKKKYQF